MSLNTGFRRDYGPGVSYREYFASSELMFPELVKDRRLRQKDLIFGVRVPGGVKAWTLATFADGAVINDHIGFVDVVVIRGRLSPPGPTSALSVTRHCASPASTSSGDARAKRRPRLSYARARRPDASPLPGHVAYWFPWAGYFENALLGGRAP